MVIDIASLDLKDRPVLALENLDETPIAILGNAFNIEAHIAYNDMSQITFDLPAYANGQKTQGYDDVIGTRLIRIPGWGVFILVNPETVGDGIKEIKSCKAYSREYEMTYKKMSLEENTYNLWNPVTPDSTILGIVVKEYLPYWHIGSVDSDLVGKYRTFSESNVNLYNFLKTTVQQKYGCVVDFDTVNRAINVRSTASHTDTDPVWISLDNLAREISREEDTENIFTCLDVNGAEGVTIRGVNPTGTNKIYNLDYYMNTSHFPQAFIDKWRDWEAAFSGYQQEYQLLTIQRMIKTSELVSAQANADEIYGAELGALEVQQSVYVEVQARSAPGSTNYMEADRQLNGYTDAGGVYHKGINEKIAEKETGIAAERAKIASLTAEKDALTAQLEEINRRLAFDAEDESTHERLYFTDEEILLLKQYFKEDSIQDSSFVYAEAKNYTGTDETRDLSFSSRITISGADVETDSPATGRTVLSCRGGTLTCGTLTAAIIRAVAEYNARTHHLVLTAYLSAGTLGTDAFPNGCLTAVTDGGGYSGTSVINFAGGTGRMYFTRNTTEYEKYAVEWDLYEYGRECLEKLSYPSYSFSVDSADFLSLDEFAAFKNALHLGRKIYLDMGNDTVLEPIFIGFELDLENPASLKLEFGDKYCLRDSAFELADLLTQSVSMGKTVDTSRFGYNAFIDSGASTAVKDYMDAALDVSKQAILSSGNIAISWDESGMKFRKWNSGHTGYEDEQIAIINNNIVFTDDGWQSAKMAIGHFHDANKGDSWGIVAPNIVGTLLAGENLVIESTKPDGVHMAFKVDADGAVLYNSKLDIVRANLDDSGHTQSTSTHILLDPDFGFGIGTYPVIDPNTGIWSEANAKFWVDMQGNVHIKGRLEGADGTFSGTLSAARGTFAGDISAATGTFSGVVQAADFLDSHGNSMLNDDNQFTADYLNLLGLTITDGINPTFSVSSNGRVTVNGNITMSDNSTIIFSAGESKTIGDVSATAESAEDIAIRIAEGRYDGGTFISGKEIYTPTIYTNLLNIYPEEENDDSSGGIVLYGRFLKGNVQEMFRINYYDSGGEPITELLCAGELYMPGYNMSGGNIHNRSTVNPVQFRGLFDFSNATVTGLSGGGGTAVFG